MKIPYILTPDGKWLFSFTPTDYNVDGITYIDGGLFNTRSNTQIQYCEIDQCIDKIRTQFKWGQNYDKDNNRLENTVYRLLQDLTTDHIIAILTYFTKKLVRYSSINDTWIIYHLIFLTELKYRYENNIYQVTV